MPESASEPESEPAVSPGRPSTAGRPGRPDQDGELGGAGRQDTATAVLRRHLWRVLASGEAPAAGTTGPGPRGAVLPGTAMATVRAATGAAIAGARLRLAAGDTRGAISILEAGRGLALFAATEVRPATDRLERAGLPDLARRWRAAAGVREPHLLPDDLRREVLAALRAHSPSAALLAPPTLDEIQEALASAGADALVHLLPGHAVIAPAAGPAVHLPLPSLIGAGGLAAGEDPYGWAWDAAIGPILSALDTAVALPRLVLVPMAELSRVPWQAARRRDGAYATELAAFSLTPSARLFCQGAGLASGPPSAAALFVGDVPEAQRAPYPQARHLDGSAASAAQLRAWLVTTSPSAGETLHVGDGGSPAPADVLALRDRALRRPIDLVVLAARGACSGPGEGDFGLATAFLASGSRSVWTSDGSPPAGEVVRLAHRFRRRGRPAWAALRDAQLAVLDHRLAPTWSAVVHHGC